MPGAGRKNGRFVDLTGRKFDRLTVVRVHGFASGTIWECVCECGSTRMVKAGHLRSGNTQSCGCLARERTRAAHVTHGMRKTPEYTSWVHMRARCNEPKNAAYHNYGGRGIKVCERWLGSEGFANFVADLGRRPTDAHTVERIDNSLGYSPDNCRWATRSEQARNTRRNVLVALDGETLVLSDWCARRGLNLQTVSARLRNGWTMERALNTPTIQMRTRGARGRFQ